MSNEARFLLLMAGGTSDDELRALADAGLDWQVLGILAEREHTFPVFWNRIARVAKGQYPAELGQQMSRRAMVAQFSLLNQMRLLQTTLAALNAAGIESILLKGAGLAAGLYKSFVERPMGDVVLLVRPEAAVAARDVLLQAGWMQHGMTELSDFYAGHHHLEPFFDAKGSGASLELHTDILALGHPFELSVDKWWERHQVVSVGPQPGWAPSPLHQLLHVCVHFAWSNGLGSSSWNAFRDAATLIREGRIDWDEFTKTAAEARAHTCAYWTLHLAKELARVDVPGGVLERLHRPKAWARALVVRDFSVGFSATGIACPSTRLRRAIWEAAVQPEASGHGDIRPWVRDHLFTVRTPRADAPGGWRIAAWRKYLAAVLRGTPAARAVV